MGLQNGYVRRFGGHWIAQDGQKVEGKRFLGRLTNLAPKGKGESSMSVTRLNPKGWKVKRRKSCSHGEAWIG